MNDFLNGEGGGGSKSNGIDINTKTIILTRSFFVPSFNSSMTHTLTQQLHQSACLLTHSVALYTGSFIGSVRQSVNTLTHR